MHFFIIGSSAVITYLIFNSLLDCFKKDYRKENYKYIKSRFPYDVCLFRINTLQFFSQEENFNKLKKVLDFDNGIYEKTLKLIQDNQDISSNYYETQNYYGKNIFNHKCIVPSIIEIRETKFSTSLPQLNYIRWLIINDYFLHIE